MYAFKLGKDYRLPIVTHAFGHHVVNHRHVTDGWEERMELAYHVTAVYVSSFRGPTNDNNLGGHP